MSVWRREGRHVDPPLDWQDPDDNNDPGWVDRLFEPNDTVPRRPVEGSPPWDMQEDVAEGHSANWEPQDRPSASPTVILTADRDIPAGHLAAIRDAIDPQPVPFTATVEPSPVLARAAQVLPPTFTQELLTRPLHEIPQLIGEEVPGE